jgi:hypothetical protein
MIKRYTCGKIFKEDAFMSSNNLSETVANLQKEVEQLTETNREMLHEMERLRAVNEIRNLINKLQFLHTANLNDEVARLFARKDPDVRLYFGDQGYWVGPEGPEKAGKIMDGIGGAGPQPGMLALHLMANPVIQVAGDCRTARATFVASGIVANKNRQTGEPTAMWEWNRYGDDFIKEDGEWKIWHHHVYPLFNVGWDEKWADQFNKSPMSMPMPDDLKPDCPPTPADVHYRPDAALPYVPVPPEPYDTWTKDMGY